MTVANPEFIAGKGISDAIGSVIQTSVPFISTTYAATSAIDCYGYSEIDFYIRVSAAASVTQIGAQIEFSELLSPSPILDTDWALLQSQSINAGQATLNDYTLLRTIPNGLVVYTLGVTSPVRGRWMRMLVTATVGAVGGSAYTVSAFRR